MKLPKLNDKLIDEVLAHIKRFPGAYQQNIVSEGCEVSKATPCGAIGCFGGWAVLLSHPKKQRSEMAEAEVDLGEAQELLGLTSDESDYLFDVASGDPKDDYKTVKGRVANIRHARKFLAEAGKDVLSVQLNFDGTTIEYSGE